MDDVTELLDLDAASALLEVPVEQVQAMADQGLITPEGEAGELRFRRAELLAARELGA